MSILSQYLVQERTRRAVRRSLQCADADGRAARSLFALNRHARLCPADRAAVYAHKAAMLRYYCLTLPYAAKPQVQKRYCNRCGGSGQHHSGDACFYCNGTGVFAETELILFHFIIAGVPYSWHQVRAYIDWPVQFSRHAPGGYVDLPVQGSDLLSHEDVSMHTWVLYEYLAARRAVLPPFPGFTAGFVLRFYRARLALPNPLQGLAAWLHRHHFSLPSWLAKYVPEDEFIPF